MHANVRVILPKDRIDLLIWRRYLDISAHKPSEEVDRTGRDVHSV